MSDGRYTQYEWFECTVIDENETSDWIEIKTRVKRLPSVLQGPVVRKPINANP